MRDMTRPVRDIATGAPATAAAAVDASHAWATSARNPVPSGLCSVRISSPRSLPYQPIAEALTSRIRSPWAATAPATVAVPSVREARISCL